MGYLDELNSQQRAAVEYLGGPELVIAGAGSGKTRVLTYKIMHLLFNGYESSRILALTFTNKAAKEMRERIDKQVGQSVSKRLWMGTFHSVFSRILRANAEILGFTKHYTIYDSADSKSLIKLIIKDMDLDEKVYSASAVQNEISKAKNRLLSPLGYAQDYELNKRNAKDMRPRLADIYKAYMERCRISNAMDFDDLLYYTARLFQNHPDILNHYREYFRYVLVDEFQDTNYVQNFIVEQLTLGIGNLCVVGDDAQSIYSFRGAKISNILELNRAYPNLVTFKLERNYRSTQNIISAANSLIDKNSQQIKKNIYSENAAGQKIEVHCGHSDYDEAGLVANRIVAQRSVTGDPFSEFAILYRTNAQSRVLEEALRRRNIVYKIYGGLAFYQRKEVKDAISYFKLAVNPGDDEALRRVINVPTRGIGATTLSKLSEAAFANQTSIWEVICKLETAGLKINSGTMKKLVDFRRLIQSFIDHNATDAEELAKRIITDTGLMAQYLSETTPENITKTQNLEELLNGAHEFVADQQEAGNLESLSMADFLATVSLQTDQDNEDPATADSVTLMTIHASKGLEFSNIFVVGVEKDLLPSMQSLGSEKEIEEERRLFYVAITRAKNFCMLSYANKRYINGQEKQCLPSPFLNDIDPQYLKFSMGARQLPSPNPFVPKAAPQSRTTAKSYLASHFTKEPEQKQESLAGADLHSALELKVGTRILHAKFGFGKVLKIERKNIGDSIEVKFDNEQTTKTLLLKFAKFKIFHEENSSRP